MNMSSCGFPACFSCVCDGVIREAEGLISRGWPFGRPGVVGRTSPKHRAKPCDRPCRPRARQRVGVGGGPTCRIEINPKVSQECLFTGGVVHCRGTRDDAGFQPVLEALLAVAIPAAV